MKLIHPTNYKVGCVIQKRFLPLIEQDWALGHAQPNELLVQHHQSLAENDVCVMQVCPPLYRQKDKNDYRLTGFVSPIF